MRATRPPWSVTLLLAAGCEDPDRLRHAVMGEASGDLAHFSTTCFLRNASLLGPPVLELTLFPYARGGRLSPGHDEAFSLILLVPAPPVDGTRTAAWNEIGSVEHLQGLEIVGGAASPVHGAVTYSQGIPAGDICGGGIDCRVTDREMFIHHLRIPEAEHTLPDGSGTWTFGGEITDLRTYCLDDLLTLGEG